MWSTILNYMIISICFIAFIFAHDLIYNVHHKWFKFSIEKFDTIHYKDMACYKIGILLPNFVPFYYINN